MESVFKELMRFIEESGQYNQNDLDDIIPGEPLIIVGKARAVLVLKLMGHLLTDWGYIVIRQQVKEASEEELEDYLVCPGCGSLHKLKEAA
jgi:hypothetical protein